MYSSEDIRVTAEPEVIFGWQKEGGVGGGSLICQMRKVGRDDAPPLRNGDCQKYASTSFSSMLSSRDSAHLILNPP
jgi:hypothetical protein